MRYDLKNPTHLKEIHAYEAHKAGILGEGIGVAVLDTGIYPHPDFFVKEYRIDAFSDFVYGRTYPYDDANHGTHICGIIASGGTDMSGRYMGIAPCAHLIVGKILDFRGNGKIPAALASFQWILQNRHLYNIRIVNISVGMPVEHPTDEFSPFMEAVNELWDAGLVVVAAAGNNGPDTKTITAPGISRKIITVGSCDTRNNTGSVRPVSKKGDFYAKHNLYSGRGPTINCVKKPDLCAPGNDILSCHNMRTDYILKSGTSMSTPMVSGAAALLLSKESSLSNKEVKRRLIASARDLHLPWQQQGAGLLDIKRMLSL
ncbi:MAG: S8 family peptidase [Lachnospiraceae bacterium]|nr:S8 family peptidase [Lachnospiraceae bacterium]